VGALVSAQVDRPLSTREGEFQAGGVSVSVFKVLFDTGALHKSYISADLVKRYRESRSSCIFPHRAMACLADQATRIETKEVVRGTLSFVADDGSTEYSVWNMQAWTSYWAYLILRGIFWIYLLRCYALDTDMRPGEIIQWSTGEVEESPEEEETPVPVAFGPVLAFMETGYDEARTEYFSSLKDHVGDLLTTCPEFMEILQSDLCVDRFVPKEWTGIKGFPPLDLTHEGRLPSLPQGTVVTGKSKVIRARQEGVREANWLYVSALDLSLGVSVGNCAEGDEAIHTLLWGLPVAEHQCVEDSGVHPTGTVRGREGHGFQDLSGYRHDQFFSPVSSDRAIESAPGYPVALGSGGADLFA